MSVTSKPGGDHCRVAPHAFRHAGGERFAVIEHRQAIADAHHQLDVMLNHQQGFAVIADTRK